MTFLAAAGLMTALEAGLVMLVMNMVFFHELLIFVMFFLDIAFLLHATFFHLALITVFIFVKTLLELVFLLSLHESNPVLLNERFYLASCLCVIRNRAISPGFL